MFWLERNCCCCPKALGFTLFRPLTKPFGEAGTEPRLVPKDCCCCCTCGWMAGVSWDPGEGR